MDNEGKAELSRRQKRHQINLLPAEERVELYGYRGFVGGEDVEAWYGIGKLQYHFLVARGLRPHHKFLDIGCGSLRLGQFIIPYLDAGNYTGLEPEKSLVEQGLKKEFYAGVRKIKRPRFFHNYRFDFEGIVGFDVAMAQSVFTHLTEDDIRLCLGSLAKISKKGSRFFATFFEGDSSENEHDESHANRTWRYSVEEMRSFASDCWEFKYIGNWQHPVKQKMLVYTYVGAKPSIIVNSFRFLRNKIRRA